MDMYSYILFAKERTLICGFLSRNVWMKIRRNFLEPLNKL